MLIVGHYELRRVAVGRSAQKRCWRVVITSKLHRPHTPHFCPTAAISRCSLLPAPSHISVTTVTARCPLGRNPPRQQQQQQNSANECKAARFVWSNSLCVCVASRINIHLIYSVCVQFVSEARPSIRPNREPHTWCGCDCVWSVVHCILYVECRVPWIHTKKKNILQLKASSTIGRD